MSLSYVNDNSYSAAPTKENFIASVEGLMLGMAELGGLFFLHCDFYMTVMLLLYDFYDGHSTIK
jgi:hypothetical protein